MSIDPKLIEDAARALGDARDRLLALLPMPGTCASEYLEEDRDCRDCLSCKHGGANSWQHPCDECIGDPTSANWTPKEPEQPRWDETPEFGDEVKHVTGRQKYHVVYQDGDRLGVSAGDSVWMFEAPNLRVTRKAELRVGDIAESRTTGRRGYVCKICCHWALNAWGRIEHNLTRADLKLIARGEKP